MWSFIFLALSIVGGSCASEEPHVFLRGYLNKSRDSTIRSVQRYDVSVPTIPCKQPASVKPGVARRLPPAPTYIGCQFGRINNLYAWMINDNGVVASIDDKFFELDENIRERIYQVQEQMAEFGSSTEDAVAAGVFAFGMEFVATIVDSFMILSLLNQNSEILAELKLIDLTLKQVLIELAGLMAENVHKSMDIVTANYGNLRDALLNFNQPDDATYQGIFEYYRNDSNSTPPGRGAGYAYGLWAAYHPDNKTEGNISAASNVLTLVRHYDLYGGVPYDDTQSKRVEDLIKGTNNQNVPSLDKLLGDFLQAMSDLETFSRSWCGASEQVFTFACVSNFYRASSFMYQAVAGSLAVKEVAQYTYRQMQVQYDVVFNGRAGYPLVIVDDANLSAIHDSYRQLNELAHKMYSDNLNTQGKQMPGVLTATICNNAGKDIHEQLSCGYFAVPEMRKDQQAAEANGGWRKNGGCTTWNITTVAPGASLDNLGGSNFPMFGLVQAWWDVDQMEYVHYRFMSDSGTTDVTSPEDRTATVSILQIDTDIRAELACDGTNGQFSLKLGETVMTQSFPTIYNFNLYSQYSANGWCAIPMPAAGSTQESSCNKFGTVHPNPECSHNASMCLGEISWACLNSGFLTNYWCSGKDLEIPPSV